MGRYVPNTSPIFAQFLNSFKKRTEPFILELEAEF